MRQLLGIFIVAVIVIITVKVNAARAFVRSGDRSIVNVSWGLNHPSEQICHVTVSRKETPSQSRFIQNTDSPGVFNA